MEFSFEKLQEAIASYNLPMNLLEADNEHAHYQGIFGLYLYKKHVQADAYIFENGGYIFFLTIGEIQPTKENLELVNALNIDNTNFTAYIVKNQLKLRSTDYRSNTEDGTAYGLAFQFQLLQSDKSLFETLKPLADASIDEFDDD